MYPYSPHLSSPSQKNFHHSLVTGFLVKGRPRYRPPHILARTIFIFPPEACFIYLPATPKMIPLRKTRFKSNYFRAFVRVVAVTLPASKCRPQFLRCTQPLRLA